MGKVTFLYNMKQITSLRLSSLRREMDKENIDAYLIPSADPHQSEYLPARWKTREWLSGFTGSAGILVITADFAGLWTDSRYFIQAENELAGSGIELCKQVIPHAPEHIDWLAENLPAKSTVGCDGYCFTLGQLEALEQKLSPRKIDINYRLDLVDRIWNDRPGLPKGKIREHELRFAGLTRAEKLADIGSELEKRKVEFLLLPTLDDIAWTLNLRGSDVEFNPVFVAYLMVGRLLSYLFIDSGKIPDKIIQELQEDAVIVKPYDEMESFLADLPSKKNVLFDPAAVSIRLYDAIVERKRVRGPNFVQGMKAVKNAVEIAGMEKAMVKDGIALVKLFIWLEQNLNSGKISEAGVAEKLASLRKAEGEYVSESFPAIVGYNGNGAIIHYRPDAKHSATLKPQGILLLDSGGQYLHGTTDITRTVALGKPTAGQKRNFTLVLKGCIALTRIKFPEKTTGVQLDAFARQFLWQAGLNYGHGTGHGVGCFLLVHESPQGFAASAVTSRGTSFFSPGMVTSNEPGFYKAGEYGIRVENLILCEFSEETAYGRFLSFRTLSLCPVDQNLIDQDLLSADEKKWVNDYHNEVFSKLSPGLSAEETDWLKGKCTPIR